GLIAATLSSVWLGLAGAALTVVLALPLGLLATRHPSRLVTVLERAAYLGQGVPGIVIALAFITITIRTVRPLYQTALTLIIAYAILFLPLALVSVRAALAQAERGLEEVGRSLGLGWVGVARRILLPLAGPGLGAAAALVFVSIVTELTATLLLAPIGTNTLAMQVWADTSTLAFAAAAPYAAMMVLLSLFSTWLLARRFGATRLFQQ
ncbi:MAG: ABC transporter permease, partial [Acetobacteraceae bacterium]